MTSGHPGPSGPDLPIRCRMVSVVALRGSGDDTRMLIARRASRHHLDGVWSYIAGHILPGEPGWQAARRELQEETGLRPEAFYATSFCERFYEPRADCIELVPSFVARIARRATVQLNDEHTACDWVTLDEAARRLPFGSQRDLLAHVQREFIGRPPSPWLRIPVDGEG